MSVRRTFSIDEQNDARLRKQPNMSGVVNEALKKYFSEIEEQQMIEAYKAMGSPEAMAEYKAWESATVSDGL